MDKSRCDSLQRNSLDGFDKMCLEVRRLEKIASSKKTSPKKLEEVWEDSADYVVALALVQNIKCPGNTLRSILFFTLDKLMEHDFGLGWDEDGCQEIIEALRKNPQTPEGLFDEAECYWFKEEWEKDTEKYEYYGPDEDSRDIMEKMDD